MFRANDINGNSVYIDDVDKNNKYFCPACSEPLVLKIFGTRKKHCFSHFPNTICKDNWKYEPMSDWHLGWQNYFNKDNKEVWIKGENESHRADIYINNTIIEIQHSRISSTEFNKRNLFYTNCNKRIIWIFDVKKQISLNSNGTFVWEKGNIFENTFINFENYNGTIEVFFEIENDILIPIKDFDKKLFFKFETFDYITKWNFLKNYIDLSVIEEKRNCKYYSLDELLRRESSHRNNIFSNNYIHKTKSYTPFRGPKERYLPGHSITRNYNRGKRR